MNSTLSSATPVLLEEKIREAAYFQWLDRGCPTGEDQAHWFAAKKEISGKVASPVIAPAHSITPAFPWPPGNPGAIHPGVRPDQRPEVLASGAIQRKRASHSASTHGSHRS